MSTNTEYPKLILIVENNLTKNLNKSLITLNDKPVISHIIDKFKENTEFVIPLGFDGKKVKEYLSLAYPKKKFFFVKIKKFILFIYS